MEIERLTEKCQELKDRLESHNFKVVRFQVSISPDMRACARVEDVGEIVTIVTINELWPSGTIKVSALVQ